MKRQYGWKRIGMQFSFSMFSQIKIVADEAAVAAGNFLSS